MIQGYPFKTAEDEAAALFATMDNEQLKRYRQRVIDGLIAGYDPYTDKAEHCGCAYATAWFVLGRQSFYWDDLNISGTLLEDKVIDINPGDTPANNRMSAWLLEQVDAAIARV